MDSVQKIVLLSNTSVSLNESEARTVLQSFAVSYSECMGPPFDQMGEIIQRIFLAFPLLQREFQRSELPPPPGEDHDTSL